MNREDKIFVGYIYTLGEDGYVEENKFVREIAVNEIPQVGKHIVTFYDEVKPFYNLHYYDQNENAHYMIENNKLMKIDIEQKADHLNGLLKDYVALLGNVKCVNLHGTRSDLSDDISKYNTIKMGLERNLGIHFESKEEIFTVEKYQDIHNQLRVYSALEEPSVTMLVSRMLRGVNTILAMDEIIPFIPDTRLFATYNNLDEDEEDHLDYSGASRDINTLLDYYAVKRKPSIK